MIKLTNILQEIDFLSEYKIDAFLNRYKAQIYKLCRLYELEDDNGNPLLKPETIEFELVKNGKGKEVAILKSSDLGWEASFNREDIDFNDDADIAKYKIYGRPVFVATYNI